MGMKLGFGFSDPKKLDVHCPTKEEKKKSQVELCPFVYIS